MTVKRSIMAAVLLGIGVALLCGAVMSALIATGNRDIIGGADVHTLLFVFFRDHGGCRAVIALVGLLSAVAAIVLYRMKK